MPFHQVREAIDDLASMHHELADAYEALAECVDDPKAARLYRLIGVEERAVFATLEEFQKSAPDEVLSTWLQYMPDASLVQIRRAASIERQEAELDRIVERVIGTNEELRKLYRQLASVSSAERIRETFSDIESIQLAKISRIATSAKADELMH